jgi:plastocyanin
MKSRAVLIAATAVTLAVLGWAELGASASGRGQVAEPSAAWAKRITVDVEDNFFDPRSTQVHAGGRVVWRWKGLNRHNVRFTKVPKGASRRGSRTLTEGRFKRRFYVPGVYRYVCTLFAGMRGSVTVVPPAPPAS